MNLVADISILNIYWSVWVEGKERVLNVATVDLYRPLSCLLNMLLQWMQVSLVYLCLLK